MYMQVVIRQDMYLNDIIREYAWDAETKEKMKEIYCSDYEDDFFEDMGSLMRVDIGCDDVEEEDLIECMGSDEFKELVDEYYSKIIEELEQEGE